VLSGDSRHTRASRDVKQLPVMDLIGRSSQALQGAQQHPHWHAASSRHRTKIADELIAALGDASMNVEAFCAGLLRQYRQTIPVLHFSSSLLRDGLLYRVADNGGVVMEAAAGSRSPLVGTRPCGRMARVWSGDSAPDRRAEHLDVLVETSRSALRTPIIACSCGGWGVRHRVRAHTPPVRVTVCSPPPSCA
jgi:hypothetical protein